MRKAIVDHVAESAVVSLGGEIDLQARGCVRVTSEDATHPIECALQDRGEQSWRAALPGPQTIWISFDAPEAIREIYLRFETTEQRTQEFVLLVSSNGGRSYRELARQQFTFSSEASTENENYFPDLSDVTDLKLTIVPDISGGDARATLRALRIR